MSVTTRPGVLEDAVVARDRLTPFARRRTTRTIARQLLTRRDLLALAGVLSFGVAIRLVQITQPFVDAWSWRETDVAMVARNFSRHGFNIFYPQVDWAGTSPGYVGTEFPLIPFLVSLLYPLVGEHEWIGRSMSVFWFGVSVPFLYLLVKSASNQRSALFGVLLYTLAPLGIFCGRSFMPDLPSLALSIAALYLFAEWLDRPEDGRLFAASCGAASLAILVKAPAIVIGVPLAYLAAQSYGLRVVRIPRLWTWTALVLGFPVVWYLHAYAVSRAYVPHHMFGEGGLRIVTGATYVDIAVRATTSGLTPLVALAALAGLVLPSQSRFGAVFHWWLVGIILFTFLAGRGSSLHPWYQLPLVPVAAALAGRACDAGLGWMARHGRSRLGVGLACLFVVAVAGLAVAYVRPLYTSWAGPLRDAGRELDRIAPATALVVFTEWDPTTVYYSKRKGWRLERPGFPWSIPRDTEDAIRAVDTFRAQGARYLVFTRHSRWWFDEYPGLQRHLESRYRPVRDTDEYVIFELTPAKDGQMALIRAAPPARPLLLSS